jgi:hypothetical protein
MSSDEEGVWVLGRRGGVEFAGALARVAIASLGGPLAGVQEVAKEVAGRAGQTADVKASAADLHDQVARAITSWARAESVSAEDRELGLALAADTIKRHGLDTWPRRGTAVTP